MRAKRPTGKQAIAAALRAFTEAHRDHTRTLAHGELSVRKLADVAACIANEIAAASAAHVAELTALRQEIAACFRPGEETERRVVRRLRDKAGA